MQVLLYADALIDEELEWTLEGHFKVQKLSMAEIRVVYGTGLGRE